VKFVTPAMGSGVSLLCESRFDLKNPQVLFAKLHFKTGNSECHVGIQEGGFGRYKSVLVSYIYIYKYTIQVLFECTSNSSVALNI
jgi:hypothetical protein